MAPTASVIGDVTLHAGASVWYGAVLRGDVESIAVGASSNVQDNCTLHADPGFPVNVGERVSIGHNAVVHGATVEDDCLIGMGATVLNGAVIGAGSWSPRRLLCRRGCGCRRGRWSRGPGEGAEGADGGGAGGLTLNGTMYAELAKAHRDQHGAETRSSFGCGRVGVARAVPRAPWRCSPRR